MELKITKTDNQIGVNFDGDWTIDDTLTALFTVQLECMKKFINSVEPTVSPETLQALKEDLYDKYNAGASNILYLFIPDKELHPDLTVEAMKEAEDNYMYRRLNRQTRRGIDKNERLHKMPKV